MNESLHVWILGCGFGDGHWNPDVCILKVLLLLIIDVRPNGVDDRVLISDDEIDVLLICHVIQLHVGLVAQIGGWLEFFELQIPDGRSISIRVDTGRAHSRQHGACGHAENTAASEHGSIDARDRVTTTLIVDVHPLQLVVSSWHGDEHAHGLHILICSNNPASACDLVCTKFHFIM